jgi:4-hydroxybenzoate polyprenyltransferase
LSSETVGRSDRRTVGPSPPPQSDSPTVRPSDREGQNLVGDSLLVRYANFVRLPHTIFALPFALLGLLVASREYRVTWRVLGLVVLAFTCARFVALGFNRIADRELDARNPRTRSRELPAGRLTLGQAWVAVTVAALAFLGSAWALNPLCLALSPLALVFISAYSYAKRFTHWSHLWLGLADGIATPAGYLAVTGRWSDPWWMLVAGAAAVTFWVGGFDVLYALQDEQFDRRERLKSLVVRLGPAAAIVAAKVLHGLAIVALVAFGLGAGLGPAYYTGVAAAAVFLAYEHWLVRPGDLSRLDAAFFTANGIVSIVVFLGALVDRIL